MKRTLLLITLLLAFPASSFAGTLQSGSVDLASDGITINGASADDQSGQSSAAVGDVNGDGIGDTLVGAPFADPSGKNAAGSAYVVFGSRTENGSVNLGTLGARGFRIDGAVAGDHLGYAVAPAGDVNGDGYADVLVSAPDASSKTGAAYVIFGKASTGSVSTASLTGFGIRIAGSAAGAQFGLGDLDGGRDVTGDGKSDIVVGAQADDNNGRTDSGSVYVFNAPTADTTAASAFARVDGAQAGDKFGSAVAFTTYNSAAALVVGAPGADRSGRADTGEVAVLAVKAGTSDASGAPVRSTGAASGDKFGASVANLGDFNGDGKTDIAIGAPFASPNGTSSGSAYVVTNVASFNAASFANGIRVDGGATGDQLGNAVAGGDVNSDNLADLVVGSYGASHRGRNDSGSAYVIFGGTTSNVNVASIGSTGATIDGPQAYCQLGISVSAGDQNGDGIVDAVVSGSLCGSSYQGITTIVIGWDTPDVPVPPVVPPTPPTPPTPPVCVGGVDNNRDGICDTPVTPETPVTPVTPVTPTTPITPTKPVVPKRAVAKIKGVGGCVKRSFVAKVTGQNIKGTTFTVDGKTFKVFNKTASSYSVKINPARYKYGTHKVSAKVKFVSGATKKEQTLRFAFQRCKPKKVTPHTTG